MMHYGIEVNQHFIYHNFKRLWSVKMEQQKLSTVAFKILRNFLTSLIIHSVQTYFATISGTCKRLSKEEKEAGHEYVYCLFL